MSRPQPPTPPPIKQTQLAQMLGRLRPTPIPTTFGSGTQIGDPTKIAPSTCPQAKKVSVKWELLDSNNGGYYDHETNSIAINSLERLVNSIKSSGINAYEEGSNAVKPDFFMPGVLPHKVGHAVFREILNRRED